MQILKFDSSFINFHYVPELWLRRRRYWRSDTTVIFDYFYSLYSIDGISKTKDMSRIINY